MSELLKTIRDLKIGPNTFLHDKMAMELCRQGIEGYDLQVLCLRAIDRRRICTHLDSLSVS